MEKVKVLVTGGAGFIGSHMVELLLEKGYCIRVLDNFVSGKKENLQHLLNHPYLTLIKADISKKAEIQAAFEGISWVFHFAALADIVPSISHPDLYYESNVTGTFNVLEAARKHGVKRFIYAASSSCYGISKEIPTTELAPIETLYPYALTKYLAEQLLLHWCATYDFPGVSLRLFNVYGPRSRTSGTYGAVLGVFLAQKLNHSPLTIVGDGKQTRDFIHVKDVTRAAFFAACSSCKGEVFNIGFGKPRSVNTLASLIGGEKTHIPKRPGEPDCTHADISKAQRLLSWSATIPLEEGIEDVLSKIHLWEKAPLWTQESIARETKLWFKHLQRAS